ncbi:MAG: histidine kinase [Acidobacteria bacterium]|nr:MAG: histidine kinase [Acidobacteriota bacterium]
MSRRVQDILLVSSLYESFILAEDGQLNELIVSEFLDLNLRHTPNLTRLSTGAKALELAQTDPRYNLIITTINAADMQAHELAQAVRDAGLDVPVVLLAFDNRELRDYLARNDTSALDRVFLWQGDARILLAIVKDVEDRWNAEIDCDLFGVQVILVVEDNIRYYSAFLPLIYTEVVAHSQRLISEGINVSHKILRMRARPKILLATTFEEAWRTFERHADNVLGVISDIEFPRAGEPCPTAGVELARRVRDQWPDVPILLQSSRPENAEVAREVGAEFLLKGSPTLLHDLRRFMVEHFAFGDFVFRMPDGREVGRAHDLKTLEEMLARVPAESIAFHGERNHFSNWLKARTEFELAERLRPRRVEDFRTLEDLRRDLIAAIAAYRRERHRGIVADFDPANFDPEDSFARIGGGSLGGKARGLAFVRRLLAHYWRDADAADVRVFVPPAVVLGTDVFDEFLRINDLQEFALSCRDDTRIRERFRQARFPEAAENDLRAFLSVVREPLAVRSSSLLEDSQYQPFTGVYETCMLANAGDDLEQRLARLLDAVKLVYASTFSVHAKTYVQMTPYRLEEEKMAVIVQRLVGARHGNWFYPHFAGVARSYNFYPVEPARAEDGIAAVALGLGRMVVAGGRCVRFCPRYPQHFLPTSSAEDVLDGSQRSFWALPMDDRAEYHEVELDIAEAERHGTLGPVASTFSPENNALYDGLSRPGIRVVTFAPVLKHGLFPLAEVTRRLLEIGERGMASPVEIEFAVNLEVPPGQPPEYAFLQMRPMVLANEGVDTQIEIDDPQAILCRSAQVLGSGRIAGIHDVVYVDEETFDRARTREAAAEIARFNARLLAEGRRYVLIGVGRWGSADPWLGIPVTWDEIAGAAAIVEAGFRDMDVTPSQGTHFFQNLASFQVGYFTVRARNADDRIDWDWLRAQPPFESGKIATHLRFDEPLTVLMSGSRRVGVILKPGAGGRDAGNERRATLRAQD